ncbi:hypothetical protein CK203_061372 [Vitis vinifera]|uniref:Uncharacterized protein n=1 Tax=Vitis vinifera TaxID=29760 RepID=A0A438GAM1_VITVI|nr:hypothetical protein CK203_061372 [Vitis vinifera]
MVQLIQKSSSQWCTVLEILLSMVRVEASRHRDPHSSLMDAPFQPKMIPTSTNLQKTFGQIVRTHPPMSHHCPAGDCQIPWGEGVVCRHSCPFALQAANASYDRLSKVTQHGPVESASGSVDQDETTCSDKRGGRPNRGFESVLVDGEAMSTEKAANNAVYFSNEQFNAGLRFPLPSLFKEFLHFTQIPPAYVHSNIVRVLMGSLGRSVGAPGKGVFPNRSLTLLGTSKRGSLGRVGGEGLFRSFEQAVRDHFHETLPDTSFCLKLVGGRLGTSVVHPQYSPQVTTQGCSVRGTLVLKDLPFYERAREADAKAHQEAPSLAERKGRRDTEESTWVCLERGGEDLATEVPLSATAHPNKAGSSTAATVQPDVIGSDVVVTIQPDVPRPSAAAVAQPRATAHGNARL